MNNIELLEAQRRISPHIVRTEIIKHTPVNPQSGSKTSLLLKLENHQHTGSFKVRGSLNKILGLTQKQKRAGVITASTGNHGLGVAFACNIAGVKGEVFLPASASQDKIDKLRASGIKMTFVEGDSLHAEITAREYASQTGKIWVSPYNDPWIIAGQGTIGLELLEQVPDLRRVFVTVGGGGLISGIALALKDARPAIEIIGCQPLNSPEMSLSIAAGKIVSLEQTLPTLSDGSAGGLEEGSITFDLCRRMVDTWVTVTEQEIATVMIDAFRNHGLLIEGSAGVALAAAMKLSPNTMGDVIVLCGGNISADAITHLESAT